MLRNVRLIRPGPVPDVNRKNTRFLVVCKASSKPTRAEHKDIHYRLKATNSRYNLVFPFYVIPGE